MPVSEAPEGLDFGVLVRATDVDRSLFDSLTFDQYLVHSGLIKSAIYACGEHRHAVGAASFDRYLVLVAGHDTGFEVRVEGVTTNEEGSQ